MTPNEIKDYQQLKKIQKLCDEGGEWDGPVSFEAVSQECSNQIMELKRSIGQRVFDEQEIFVE